MAGAIRGITVEIGGDTTKLGKALEGTEKKSRSLQVELRQIEKLLKFDPTNTDLLAQKQDVLKNAIAETAQKLDTLKEAEAQVIAQFERGEIAEDQLRAFQREVLQTEKSLDGMRSELSSTEKAMKSLADGTDSAEKHTDEYRESVEKAKNELADFKEKASEAFDAVKTGAGILGGAALATGGYALKLSTDFDKAFNTLVTRTGASADEMDELNAAMEAVYANNFGDSIEDVAESMATVKQNTKLSGDELQNATERALMLRDTFEFDVNESTRSAKMLMDQYGLSAEDAYNLIAQGAQKGLDKNGDLLDTINEYAVHFNNLGLDAEDMFNMLANGAENGTFSVDKLGDAVKEFSIRAIDGSDSTAEGFKAIGLNADDMAKKFGKGGESAKSALQETATALFNMEDPIAQNAAGVALFGTMWEDLGADGVKALMNLDGEVSKSKDALNEINNQKYDDIGSALQGLGRTIETDVVKPLGDELKPVVEEAIGYVQANGPQIKEVLSGIVSAIGDFVGFIVNNADAILSTIAGIGAGLLIWNVVSMITGVVNAIKAFKLANEGATVAQWLLNAAMNANPIGILITVIGAIIVAITTFILTNEDARAKFVEIWNKIKEACGKAIDAIVNFFTVTIPNAWKKFLSFASTFISNVASYFSKLPGKIWTWLVKVVTNITTWGRNMTTKAVDAVSKLISKVVNFFKQLPGKIWTWLVNAVTKVVTWGKNMQTKAKSAVTSLITSVVNYFKQLPGKIWSAIVGAVSRVATWGSNLKSKAVSAVTSLVSSVFSKASQLPGKIWSAIQGAISRVRSWGSSLASAAGSAVSNMVSKVVSIAKGLPGKFLSIGRDIINGIKNGISGALGGLYASIKSGLSGLVNKAKAALGIRSPSRVFANVVGKQIPAGIAMGINNNTDVADEAVQDMTDDLTNQALSLNGATINRKLTTTFGTGSAGNATRALDGAGLMSMLQNIHDKLSRLQVVLDSGELVGGIIDPIDTALNDKYSKAARGW